MVKRAISAVISKIQDFKRAAFWLASFALISQLLALVRDRLLAHNFGAGEELDIYYAAFKIPDLIFVTVASLVSISALVPLFAKKEVLGEKYLQEATNSIFTVFSGFIVLVSVLSYFLIPKIVPIAFSGVSDFALQEIEYLSRILLLSPLLLGFSNFFGSIVQYQNRFILYALSPVLYNIGIIAGIVLGVETFGISAVVVGVCIGALLHLGLQAIFVILSDLRPRFVFNIKWNDVKEIAYLSIPRTFALSVTSFVSFVFAALAAKLAVGSIAVFNLANNLQSAPLSLIGVSFSIAAFPALAISAARNHKEEVVAKISEGLRQIIFWSLPITALIIILRAHIVRVVLGSGNFDWSDTRLTAAVLALFVISTVFQSVQLFLSRSLYALGKTKWPLIANVAGGGISICVAYYIYANWIEFRGMFMTIENLLNINDLNAAILVLPLSFSLGFIVSSVLLFYALGNDIYISIVRSISATIRDALIAALSAGLGGYLLLYIFGNVFNLDTFTGVFSHGIVGGLSGIAFASVALYLLGNEDVRGVIRKVK